MDFLPDFYDSDDDDISVLTSQAQDDVEKIDLVDDEEELDGSPDDIENTTSTIAGNNNENISNNDNIGTEVDREDELDEFDNDGVKVPPLSNWKEDKLFSTYIVTVAKSKRSMWDQAKKEIQMIKENISTLELPSDVASMAASQLYKVYQTLLGSSSLLCSTFCRYLKISTIDYLHFMMTFFLSCKNQQSAANLHSSIEINNDILMPLQKYTGIWAAIRDLESSRRQTEFWLLVEEAVNQELRLLFLSSDESFPYLLGFDDDKVHFQYSSKTKMQGLSPQHHQKDNRRGLTLHTCAFSAACIPLTVSFQRTGESVQDTYFRAMKDIFGVGAGGLLNLRGIILASDRGYWERDILFGQMLESGADIIGTVKRVSC